MTDEPRGDTPEEAPAPPTSTRWSEDAVAEDDAPPPPFVPGRREPLAKATPGAEPGAEPGTGEGTPEGGAEPAEPEPFPFELPVDAEEHAAPEEPAPEEPAATEKAAEEPTATDTAEDDFPFEQFDIEGRGEEAGRADRDGPAIPAPAAPSGPAADDSIQETAALLDRLADVLRSEGEAGVRRELDSPDRLTAVLAGILAGHLSARS